MKTRFSAFTLIELIVVMGILAILATIVVIAVNPARQFAASRNAKRASDVRAIQQAINQHAADNNGTFYASITNTPQLIGTSNLDLTSTLVPNYLSAIPADPSGGTTADTKYAVYKNTNNLIGVFSTVSELGRVINSGASSKLAASFNATDTEYFSSSAAGLNPGTASWAMGMWVYPTTTGANISIAQLNTHLWVELQNLGGGNVSLGLRFNGVNNVFAGTMAINQWHYVYFGYNGSGTAFASADGAAPTTLAMTAPSGTTAFVLGDGLTSPYNGRMEAVSYWQGRNLTNGELTTIYNAGVPFYYETLPTALKTSLVAFWELNEPSGQRNDSHGSFHLTDNNTVGSALGR